MEHYIDIHSHILPGVDDGAKDMEMTMEMIDAAYGQGVRVMIATPHYYPGHVRHPKEYVDGIFQETLSAVKEKYADFTILPAMKFSTGRRRSGSCGRGGFIRWRTPRMCCWSFRPARI